MENTSLQPEDFTGNPIISQQRRRIQEKQGRNDRIRARFQAGQEGFSGVGSVWRSGSPRLFCLLGACAKRLAILLAIGYNKGRKTKKAAAARVMYPHPERPAYGSPTCRTQRHISRTAQSLYLFPSLFSRGRGALPHVPFHCVLPKTRWRNVPNRKHLKSSFERPTWA